MTIDFEDVYGLPEDQIIPLPKPKTYYKLMLEILDKDDTVEPVAEPESYPRQKCIEDDNPRGECLFILDLEYDPYDPPACCYYCGQYPGQGELIEEDGNGRPKRFR